MTERDITGACAVITETFGKSICAGIDPSDEDHAAVFDAAMRLLRQALCDLHRIADAAEIIAGPPR